MAEFVPSTPKKIVFHKIESLFMNCLICRVDIRKGTTYGRGRRNVSCANLRDTLSLIDDDMPDLWNYLAQLGPGKDCFICLQCTNKLMRFRRTYDQQQRISSQVTDVKKEISKDLTETKCLHMRWKRSRRDPYPNLQPSLIPSMPIPSPSSTPRKAKKARQVTTPRKIPVPIAPALPMICDPPAQSSRIMVS